MRWMASPQQAFKHKEVVHLFVSFAVEEMLEMYKKVRQHSPERVLKELDQLHDEHGYSSFMWYDDEVNSKLRKIRSTL